MTDVIRNINSNNQVASSGSKPAAKSSNEGTARVADSASSAASGATEQVDLTNSSKKVDQVLSSLSAEPIVDRQKVDDIKSALAEGRYEVNSAVIAEKLIEIDDLLK